MDVPTKQIDLTSGILTYGDIGDSISTSLFLHGFSFREGLYPLSECLGSGFRVVILDFPFSMSYDYLCDHTLENYVDLILEIPGEFRNISTTNPDTLAKITRKFVIDEMS